MSYRREALATLCQIRKCHKVAMKNVIWPQGVGDLMSDSKMSKGREILATFCQILRSPHRMSKDRELVFQPNLALLILVACFNKSNKKISNIANYLKLLYSKSKSGVVKVFFSKGHAVFSEIAVV